MIIHSFLHERPLLFPSASDPTGLPYEKALIRRSGDEAPCHRWTFYETINSFIAENKRQHKVAISERDDRRPKQERLKAAKFSANR
jgi:hypothetical protein